MRADSVAAAVAFCVCGTLAACQVDVDAVRPTDVGADVGTGSDTADAVDTAPDATGDADDAACDGLAARIEVLEGLEVVPQTKLHLIGSLSCGDIARYQWEVAQPVGSRSVFLPSATAPDPTFEANVAGLYVFRLVVTGMDGEVSERAEASVTVTPDHAVHVELVWDTPSDPNQTDEGPAAGADLDLHLLAPGGAWFDSDGVDCFWGGCVPPSWGGPVTDDRSLDRDDNDGAGPENINANVMPAGVYRVGVHTWDAHGFAPSYATVRVYLYGVLVFECEDMAIGERDFIELGTLSWPDGATAGRCGADVVHDFSPPPWFGAP